MCISYGGVKMTLKGLGRNKKLVRWECPEKGCGRLWALTPDALYITGRGMIFDGYDFKGRKSGEEKDIVDAEKHLTIRWCM